MSIRLVTFDILHTIITPRLPIHEQYALAFKPFLGPINPLTVKSSFKSALAALQRERPAYDKGSGDWWSEVIYRTALASDADPTALKDNLHEIVDNLMHRFSSREGYKAFDDAIPTFERLHARGIRTAVLSNSDSRSRLVLKDLGFPDFIDPILLSEEEGIEKPSTAFFLSVLDHVGTNPPTLAHECLHVGDELQCDYRGAIDAGMRAVLLRRPEEESSAAEDLTGVEVVSGLDDVIRYL